MAKEGKKLHIELMRIIAAFLVIVNHTNSRIFLEGTPSATWYASLTYFFICKIAVPVFFMIMGALLLEKQDTPRKWTMRLVRISVVIVVFSAVYYLFYHRTAPETMSAIGFLQTIFSSNATRAFWYLYTYLGMLCMLPILQKMAASFSKDQMRLLLFLSLVVAGGLPLLSIFFPVAPNGYFLVALISPYLGMVFAGYYIERHARIDWKGAVLAAVLFVVSIVLQVAVTRAFYEKDPAAYLALDNSAYLNVTGSAICFYIVVKYLLSVIRIPKRLGTAICYIGGLTFGIYLLSDLTIALSVSAVYAALLPHTHILIAMVIWELVVFGAGSAATAVLKAIPGVKKWI